MESLRDLFIRLGLSVNAAEFAEGLAWEHALEKGADLVVEAGEHLGEVFIEAIEHTAEFGEEVRLFAERTGVSVEEVQKLGYAAQQSGASADDLRVSLSHLAQAQQRAADGNTEAITMFGRLGLSMSELRSESPDELLRHIADRFQKLGPGAKRTALAMEVFGRSGTSLIPMLSEGREGIDKLGIEADELGIVMGDDAAKAAHVFNDSLSSVHATVIGLEHELAGPMIEALQPLVTGILDWVKANRQLISQKVQAFAQGVISVARTLWRVSIVVGETVMWLADHLKLLAVVLGGVVLTSLLLANGGLLGLLVNFALNSAAAIAYAAVSVAAAVSAAAAWIAAAAPVVLLGAALILAALAAEDFYVFLKGGDSVVGHLLNTYGERFTKFVDDLLQPAESDGWVLTVLKGIAYYLTDIGRLWDKLSGFASFLAYGPGGRASHVKGALEGPSSDEISDSATSQAQRVKTLMAIYGSGGSPGASADAAQAGANYVHAPTFNADVKIVQQPGESAGSLSDVLTGHMDDWWDTKMREASPLAGR